MNAKRTARRSKTSRARSKTDWARVDATGEGEAEAAARSDPDALPTDAEFWRAAKIVLPTGKQPVSLRLDRDVVGWFKAQGRGYQSRINAVLRSYMSAHKDTR